MLSVERIGRSGESVILYDASLTDQPPPGWFDPDHWRGAATAAAAGRGGTHFIRNGDRDWVLRHYRRGGAVARIADDEFFWAGEARVRAFAEWRLLDRMRRCGLPVPRPVAARYVHQGLIYRADLITERLPDVQALSTRLPAGQGDEGLWRRVGACIARFHRAGFCHADLNVHNIQVGADGSVFLLDFDRGRHMRRAGRWQEANLQRLHRSLHKISRDGRTAFPGGAWAALLAGYREAGSSRDHAGRR